MLDWFGLEVFVNVLKPVCFSKSHTYFPCASLESGISDFSYYLILQRVFPDSSVGKESTCNAGDRGSIPRSGRSAGEGIGCPLQYSWASLVAQLIQNPPAMQATWVQSLGWEDPWRRERLPTPVFWSGEFHGLVHGITKSQTGLSDFHFIC